SRFTTQRFQQMPRGRFALAPASWSAERSSALNRPEWPHPYLTMLQARAKIFFHFFLAPPGSYLYIYSGMRIRIFAKELTGCRKKPARLSTKLETLTQSLFGPDRHSRSEAVLRN